MVTSRPEIVGTFGVVSSTHWLATTVAMTVLERGGNAFDAAAAAGFVLHVVEPTRTGRAATCRSCCGARRGAGWR
jgi:gamma-glutamyltranspeptidase/glutathione hydrolase